MYLITIPWLLSVITIVGWVPGSSCEQLESARSRKMVKRQSECPDGEYTAGSLCCKLCPAGTYKRVDCNRENEMPICKPCQEGREYMSEPNEEQKCHRCTSCDHGEGFEEQQRCSREANTICQCMEHFFCNTTLPCKYCKPCDKCENQQVEEECTRQKNTVCKDKSYWWIHLIVVLTILVCIGAAALAYRFIKRKKRKSAGKPKPMPKSAPEDNQEEILLFPDVNLEPHATDIAKKLTFNEMLSFVRKNAMEETIIDQVKNDYVGNTEEQKIQLFIKWHQNHGIKKAFADLNTTLKEINSHKAKDIYEYIIQIHRHL